ncbi:MAG: hypothetical protein CMP23_10205 [Rickettsiales bacterium]|nr:hypothetical protein [Rickettsiales bacterium]
MKPELAITLHRAAVHGLTVPTAPVSWSQLAANLPTAVSSRPASAALVSTTAAMQHIIHDLLQAYAAAQPDRDQLTEAACMEQGLNKASIEASAADWVRGPGLPSTDRLLLLGAQAENPALNGMESALAFNRIREHGPAAEALRAVRKADRGLPVPEGFTEAASMALGRPARECPDQLLGQLNWMLESWAEHLSAGTLQLSLLARDLLTEENCARLPGPGPAQAPGLSHQQAFGTTGDWQHGAARPGSPGYVDGQASFSEDSDWMPRLVMMAKHSYVWLAQLSKIYGTEIHSLDQIPDTELDQLAARGFEGLWLIGLWERSSASRAIKTRRGNPEAEASAYALQDYVIAERLGGPAALQRLRERAAQRGIRLAADMVPNHMGLDSRWIAEHPDWFLQLPQSPYPGYSFNGPNLSGDDRIGIYLEDGYWDESDAAVVFKRVEQSSGEVRYIYHGNDGTQMPWNDTAQLDYLQPQVREAVIQTILEVARRFPIIRFDAAMTLARKHIERLWYPPPGEGGAIPSRSENSVPRELFDRLLPGEFWREVVERIQQELPDTLLLAEAFWMMEGYFVRTLGMHRVYNSAFMHMLRDEDNAGYRSAIKNVLEYSPAILERYVNFMNNPDEESAVEQFGKGDKYFGIATMMATLPGLPMFGHGQIEGYAEKYGMEYSQAYWDESPDQGLIDHHERVIFPLLRERRRFCGVANFALLDFFSEGGVDENVFAYSNRTQRAEESSLVLYNNPCHKTSGWIRTSTAINVGDSDTPELVQRSLVSALKLRVEDDLYFGLWELRQQAWILRSSKELEEQGLFATLSGYQAMVFMHFRELPESDGRVRRLAEELAGGWIEDLEKGLARHAAQQPEGRIQPAVKPPNKLPETAQSGAPPAAPATTTLLIPAQDPVAKMQQGADQGELEEPKP